MSLKICLGCYSLRSPKAGGYKWMFINWALGLKALDVDVIWLDSMLKEKSFDYKKNAIEDLKIELQPFGIEKIKIIHNDGSVIPIDIPECDMEDEFYDQVDLFINLGYDLPELFIKNFSKSIFVDLDPGQTQVWLSLKQLYIPYHNYYFTYGENVGKSSLIPTCGMQWIHTPPPISCKNWALENQTIPSLVYTTVSNWWGNWFSLNNDTFENSKRAAFLKFRELPMYVNSPLEIAAFFSEDGFDDREKDMLTNYGWKVKHVLEVSATPNAFHSYVQHSRGEFSCLLPAYSKLKTAWTSERSLNYLAAGKPVILSDTGASNFLPTSEGILRFGNMKQATKCFELVEKDYEFHSKRAMEIANEFFEASKVIKKILEITM